MKPVATASFSTCGLVGIGTDNDNSINNDSTSDDEIFDEEAVPLRKRQRLNHNNRKDNSNDNKSSNKNDNSFSTINGHLSAFKPKKIVL